MKTKESIVLLGIALLALIALTGSAQASVTVIGQVTSTTAEGYIPAMWLDVNPSDYATNVVRDGTGMEDDLDYYYFDDITFMLDRNGYKSGDTDIPITVAMFCSGIERDIDSVEGDPYTNPYRNVTALHFNVNYVDGTYTPHPVRMELEECPMPPDLTVTDITVNYDHNAIVDTAVGPTDHPGALTQCNNISAVIEEENGVAAEAFDVTFKVDATPVCTVRVPGLAGGTNETVYCNCSWYPYADVTYTINVTVDSNGEIDETEETNNTMLKSVTPITIGYTGNHYQDGRNITTEQSHSGEVNLIYSVGDSYKGSGYGAGSTYTANWTASVLPIPAGATIEKARLYVYYDWDGTYGAMDSHFIMSFTGYSIPLSANYSDVLKPESKTSAKMLAYDVTTAFNPTGTDTAVLTNSYTDTSSLTIYGMLLVVVYNHPDEPARIIRINEGSDFVSASAPGAESWGCPADYGVSPEEAIAYAPFNEPISLSGVVSANLITVDMGVQWQYGGDYNTLYFNDGVWKGVVDPGTIVGATDLGINETDVTAHLKATDNVAAFQSSIPASATMGDLVEIMNAFLVVEYQPKPTVSISTDKTSYTTGQEMHLGLDVKNPLGSAQRVSLYVYLELPTGGTFTLIDTTVTLPAGLDYSNPDFMVLKLPSIPAGTYTWHAILDNPATGEVISEDTEKWEFVPRGAPTEDITEALQQTTVVIGFDE